MTDATVRAAADAMQWIDLLLAVAILLLSLWALVRWRRGRPVLFGLITVGLLGTAFHVATLLDIIRTPWVNLWSATLRAYIYLFILATFAVIILVSISPEWPPDEDDDNDA
jgi:hypothetical protein